jgi:hypothetical protein
MTKTCKHKNIAFDYPVAPAPQIAILNMHIIWNPMLSPQIPGFIVCRVDVVNLVPYCKVYWLISVQSTRGRPPEHQYFDAVTASHYS